MLSSVDILADFISQPDSERITDIADDYKTHNNTEDGHLAESFHEADAHPPENETDEEASYVAVPDC
jgi:hypothetical protein